jgi:hypothetical protein
VLKKNLNRRNAFKLSSTFGAAGLLGGMLNNFVKNANVSDNLLLKQFLQGIAKGSTSQMASAAEQKSQYTMVQIVLIDKCQAALFQHMEITDGATDVPGLKSAENAPQSSATIRADFRGMGLTKLFADSLVELPTNISLCMNNSWQSGSGGHSLMNSYVSPLLGGLNSVFEKKVGGTGVLGPIGFGLASDANNSRDVFTSDSGRIMTTANSVSNLALTVEESVAPLVNNKSLETVKMLDSLVQKNSTLREQLVTLGEKVGQAIPDLKTAASLQMPAMGGNGMQTKNDVVLQQVKAIIALHKAGVARNFMIAVPYDDTNGGGSLITPGGSAGLSPFEATAKIGQALVELHKAIPNLICVTTSDGGRSRNNGDQSAGFAILTGPENRVKNGFVENKTFSNTAQLTGNMGIEEVSFSDGSKGRSMPANWYATALKAAEIDIEVPHVSAALNL